MWISLSKRATMWLLGDPKRGLKANLNFRDRGPVEIDFEALPLAEQKHILVSLKQGQITTDTPFETLRDIYVENYQAALPVTPPPTKAPVKKNKVQKLQDLALKRAEEIKKRCEWLAQQTMRAIKSELKDESDIKMLRTFYEIEQQNKNRGGVLRLIESKIREHQEEVAVKIQQSMNEEPLDVRTPEATFPGNVVESEEVEITISPEELKEMASGGLGGE